MVIVCSLSEREERLHRKKNEDEEKKEGDLESVIKEEKEVKKETEVEEETAVEKLYRKIGQDDDEEMFRIIQQKKEELCRRLQEKKAKLLSCGIRVDSLALWTIMTSQLRASTAYGAFQRRKGKKRRRRTKSTVSNNNVRLGRSDHKEQETSQGAKIVSTPLISNSRLETARSLHKHRTEDKQKWFQDMFTGLDVKGLLRAILLVSFWFLSSGQNHERPTYCHISSEPITQDWKLSCQFQMDIRERRQDFQVFHVKRDGSPDLVVDGTWIEDELKAYTADGYVLDGSVSDQFVIRMQSHVAHSGQIYTCTLPSRPLENIKTCQVPKKEAYSTAMLHTPPAVHNGAWRSVNSEKMMLLITAAITCGIIFKHV